MTPGKRLLLAALPSGLFGASLGIGRIVRDCALTCNVGFQFAPLALLAIAVLTVPATGLALRLERRFGTRRWQAGSLVLAAASLVAFRALTAALYAARQAALENGTSMLAWSGALRWTYLAYYVWIGALAALLGGNAFAHVFLRLGEQERERGLTWSALAFAGGGFVGSLFARQAGAWMLARQWPFEVARDHLMLAMGLLLLLQLPLLVGLEHGQRPAGPEGEARPGPPLGEAVRALLAEPVLGRAAALVVIGGVADTLLKYLFYWLVSEHTSAAGGRTLFFANFYLWVNAASLLALPLASGRLIRRFGLVLTLASLPALLSLGAAALAVQAALGVIYVLRVLESSLRTALYEPGMDRLLLKIDAGALAAARTVLKGPAARVGEGAGAVAVLGLQGGLGLGLWALLSVLGLVLLAWLVAVLVLGRALNVAPGPAPAPVRTAAAARATAAE